MMGSSAGLNGRPPCINIAPYKLLRFSGGIQMLTDGAAATTAIYDPGVDAELVKYTDSLIIDVWTNSRLSAACQYQHLTRGRFGLGLMLACSR